MELYSACVGPMLYNNKGSAASVEVIQDDYMKEICSPGSYAFNPGRIVVKFWSNRVKAGLVLRQSILVNSLLYSAEAWSGVTKNS